MMSKIFFVTVFALLVSTGCKKNNENTISPTDFPTNTATPAFANVPLSTDKAAYSPGDNITFTMNASQVPAGSKVRYKYLNTVVSEEAVSSNTWTWKASSTDFRGYSVEVYSTTNGVETIHATAGVDVSSKWTKFPRYGFLSKFPQLTDAEINAVTTELNKYHINGLQFYDWHHKHHKPLPFNGATPASSWKEISNRDVYFNTVQKYINSAHGRNMKAMFYNLIYGAWNDAEADGVNSQWYVYNDPTHTNKDFHPLSTPFLSNIYLLDPSNTAWQQYIAAENGKVYQALAFDGFHMDQLGNRGNRFKYDGNPLNLANTFQPFINAMRTAAPQKDLVMNAVAQYGQEGISQAQVDLLYSEVWSPFETYNDLANIIKQNNVLSGNTKNSVLAAYMNYDMAKNPGFFNTSSVLMTNAVIFAFGGAHLELGEHMLGSEYFPNSNLAMRDELRSSLVKYYDFLVAYQNLLRDGGSFNDVSITSADKKMKPAKFPGGQGYVATVGKKVGNTQIIHLINFTNSTTQNWRDNSGIQVAPAVINDASLILTSSASVKNMWIASPDIAGGASMKLNFKQSGDRVTFTLPELQYWDMLVIEH